MAYRGKLTGVDVPSPVHLILYSFIAAYNAHLNHGEGMSGERREDTRERGELEDKGWKEKAEKG